MIRLFLLLYGAKETTLNMHRYITYARLNYSSKNQVKREKLPPTESAAEFHSLRVHCQILKWKNEDQTDFSPTQWGWKNCNVRFEPIDTILKPGPAELLNVIRCHCKLSTKNPCGAIVLVAKTVYLVSPPVEIVMETIAPTFQS